jgi:hypothetical protein
MAENTKPQASSSKPSFDISTILAIVSGAQQILKVAIPEAQRIFSSGDVSVEDQAKLKAIIDSIRDGSAFIGDEVWNQPPAA